MPVKLLRPFDKTLTPIALAGLIGLMTACSRPAPETPAPASPAALPAAAPAPASAPTQPASQARPMDLSPGPLPGGGKVQPGLMPGHTTLPAR